MTMAVIDSWYDLLKKPSCIPFRQLKSKWKLLYNISKHALNSFKICPAPVFPFLLDFLLSFTNAFEQVLDIRENNLPLVRNNDTHNPIDTTNNRENYFRIQSWFLPSLYLRPCWVMIPNKKERIISQSIWDYYTIIHALWGSQQFLGGYLSLSMFMLFSMKIQYQWCTRFSMIFNELRSVFWAYLGVRNYCFSENFAYILN